MSVLPKLAESVEFYSVNETNYRDEFLKALTFPGVRIQENIQDKAQFNYLCKYIFTDVDGLVSKSIIVEKNYMSASYLGDYLNYYAHCYFPYKKECRRLHFFKEDISMEMFRNMLFTNDHEDLWNSYNGYIVIKPLPKSIIGATLLRHYGNSDTRRFTAVREYRVNIMGKELKLETMPFQEQDGIVGSCASMGVWFALHKTSEIFGSSKFSPSEITILAGDDLINTGKRFPSIMLEAAQICKAINASGLISEVRDSPLSLAYLPWLKGFIYSYVKMGIPLLMGFHFEDDGDHLVTINGFRSDANKESMPEKVEHNSDNALEVSGELNPVSVQLVSDSITKIFAHDDQTGPFAKMKFIADNHFQCESSWSNGNKGRLRAKVVRLFVPLPKNIKLTFENMLDEATVLQFSITNTLRMKFEWDIFLSLSNKYKEELRQELSNNKVPEEARTVLLRSLPQYIWVIRANSMGKLIFDLIYDASDINFSGSPFCGNIYNSSFYKLLESLGLFGEYPMFSNKVSEDRQDLFFTLSKDDSMINKVGQIEEGLKDKATYENVKDELRKVIQAYISLIMKK